MKHKEYWEKRFELLEDAQNKKTVEYFAELEKQYNKAALAVQDDVNKWYARYAVNNEISLQDAKKMLNSTELEEFKWNVMDYIEKGRTLNYSDAWAKQLENASARWHISRLDSLKIQMQNHVEVLYGNELDEVTEFMRNLYTEGYYHTAYEIQKGFNIGYDLMKLDKDKIDKVLSKPWAVDGSNFSSRIWKQKNQLVSELHNNLTQAIIRGQNPSVVTDMIADRFKVSKGRASALVMTESAYFASASDKDCFNDLGVERYEILATLDHSTSDICRSLDGEVFPMSEYKVGVTAPPFHVRCRTTTVPFFDDEFELDTTRAARDEDGRTYQVPASMKYEEWKNTFVDGGSKKDLKVLSASDVDTSQEYRPINRSSTTTEEVRGSEAIIVRQIENSTYNGGIYISDAVDIKPKQMHNIETSINEALKKVDGGDNLPSCMIISSAEMQTGAVCSYNAVKNIMYIDSAVGDIDKLLELQKDMACPDNPLSTYVHEFLHWKTAEAYRKTAKITDQKAYLEELRASCKKKLDKLEKEGYNIFDISNYAMDKYYVGAYDETLTEYYVLKLLGKGN